MPTMRRGTHRHRHSPSGSVGTSGTTASVAVLGSILLSAVGRASHGLFIPPPCRVVRLTGVRGRCRGRGGGLQYSSPLCRDVTISLLNVKANANANAHSCEIFLEHTDAFGIVYNANYATLYQRALEEEIGSVSSSSSSSSSVVGAEEDGMFLLQGFEMLKYVKAASLGDVLVVTSRRLPSLGMANDNNNDNDNNHPKNDNDTVQRWEQNCTRSSDGALVSTAVSYTGTVASGTFCTDPPWLANNAPTSSRALHGPFRVYSDELSTKLTAILRWFERSRTLWLGGPSQLRRFTDEGLAVVLARIQDLRFHQSPPYAGSGAGAGAGAGGSNRLGPGEEVYVESTVTPRGKSLMVFHHVLYVSLPPPNNPNPTNSLDNNQPVVASATAMVACVNSTTGKSVTFPSWVMEIPRSV